MPYSQKRRPRLRNARNLFFRNTLLLAEVTLANRR